MGLNYHYKPATYLKTATAVAPAAGEFISLVSNYDIVYGAEQRGTDQTAGGLVTLSSVGADRKWIRELDGDPVIEYMTGSADDLQACSRRGLCDYDTGRCECFFGYMGNSSSPNPIRETRFVNIMI